MNENVLLVTNFNFEVSFDKASGRPADSDKLCDGGFQDVSGLEVQMDVQEYEEGGRNDGTVQRIGRAKYSPLVLKRGMFTPTEGSDKGKADSELWQWFQHVVSGARPARRYNGSVIVWDQARKPVVSWRFTRALPSKIVGPQLNARTGEIAIEELHLVHEGLALGGLK